jgi:hypothetical protein
VAAFASARARLIAIAGGVALALALVIAFALAVAGCRACAQPPSERVADLAAAPLACASMQGCVAACPASEMGACVSACVARLSPAARAVYDALERCVAPACAAADASDAPCRDPNGAACKLCVLSHCASQATSCMAH